MKIFVTFTVKLLFILLFNIYTHTDTHIYLIIPNECCSQTNILKVFCVQKCMNVECFQSKHNIHWMGKLNEYSSIENTCAYTSKCISYTLHGTMLFTYKHTYILLAKYSFNENYLKKIYIMLLVVVSF